MEISESCRIIALSKHHNMTTTQENPHVSRADFNSLMNSRQIQTGDDLDEVGFRCEMGNHCITFYGQGPDFTLEVEDFGRMKGGKWEQSEPTPAQLKTMQEILLLEKACIEDRLRREELQEWEEPYYPTYNWA